MKIEAFDSFIHQKKIPPKVLGQILNEVMDNFGMKILGKYLEFYEKDGGQFVRTFIKYDCIQSACRQCILYSIRQGLVIEQDEKVRVYVEKLKLPPGKADVLEKLLNIFKMIK